MTNRKDWLAFWTVWAASLGVYVYTLAPTVTLEFSGIMVTAAEYLGVPHPPGYPLWTLLAWVFTKLFGFVRYHGHPNPAWGVNFMSALFGALANGVLALLLSVTGRRLLLGRGGEGNATAPGSPAAHWIVGVCAVSASLLFAFTSFHWSQCVIADVSSLNTFLHFVILLLACLWLHQPDKAKLIYLTTFVVGVTFTNCQPVGLLVPMLLLIVFMSDIANEKTPIYKSFFADCVVVVLLAGAGMLVFVVRQEELMSAKQATMSHPFLIASVVCGILGSALFLWTVYRRRYSEWRRILLSIFFGLAGILLYIYLPVASDFNPPVNWAYARTWEGFKHLITRGQYQAMSPCWNLSGMAHQCVTLFREMESQFPAVLILLAGIPWLCWRTFDRISKQWLLAVLVTFGFLGPFFIVILNPGDDAQALFIARVHWARGFGVFALLIGYGLMLAVMRLYRFFRESRLVLVVGLGICLLLPIIPVWRNAVDADLLLRYGGAEQNGHDFGWQFGDFQLRGVEGIREDLKPGETPPPNPAYPPGMETNAIYLGGTDPARFVNTYMTFSAKVRPDVFILTQNALADNTYLNSLRDLYGDRIWIPSGQDSNWAFKTYLDDVKAGRIPMSAAINVDANGRVSVQGVQGVMEINGVIVRKLFETNKKKHSFYVEESYVVNWMYPYLEPHGLIMKLNREPLSKLTPEMVKNDKDFWRWYAERLMADPGFARDTLAQKTFSKLRCAIAGVYVFRRMFKEAELAYKQAVALCPSSPEANFRLTDLYLQHGRFDEARKVMRGNHRLDPRNKNIESFLTQIDQVESANKRMMELQIQLSTGGTLQAAMELAGLYQATGKEQPFRDLTSKVLSNTNLPPATYLEIAKMFANGKPPQVIGVVDAFQRYLQRMPLDTRIWVELSYAQLSLGQKEQAMLSLRQAIQLGGEPVKEHARQDKRFAPLQSDELFRELTAEDNPSFFWNGIGTEQ
ncbi:MAG: DUF2723 domain-containing protein [Lentisphaerae bacterium]|nr:DUF2723 domain-containing protein [Lentisphaerota bacterium]